MRCDRTPITMGNPQSLDGLEWEIPKKKCIGGYSHFRKPPISIYKLGQLQKKI